MHATTKLALTLLLAFSLSACASVKHMADAVTGSGSSTDASQGAPAEPTPGGKAVPPPVIAEFGDIPIPHELTRKDDESFIYEAPGTVIGVMTYTGRVDPSSVGNFFREQMPAQGWRFLNAYKDRDIDLFYLKDNRSCQISIKSGMIETKVIIKVGPSGAGGGG